MTGKLEISKFIWNTNNIFRLFFFYKLKTCRGCEIVSPFLFVEICLACQQRHIFLRGVTFWRNSYTIEFCNLLAAISKDSLYNNFPSLSNSIIPSQKIIDQFACEIALRATTFAKNRYHAPRSILSRESCDIVFRCGLEERSLEWAIGKRR